MYKKKSPRGDRKAFGKEDSNSHMYVLPPPLLQLYELLGDFEQDTQIWLNQI